MAKILIIEDELEQPVEDNMFILYLIQSNHNLSYATSGDEAWDLLANNQFDLVYFDIMLTPSNEDTIKTEELRKVRRPDVGVFILENIRKGTFEPTGTPKNVATLVISAVTGFERWNKIKKLTGDERYLTKPCSPELIFERIQLIINESGAANE